MSDKTSRLLFAFALLLAATFAHGQGSVITGSPVATNGVGQPMAGITVAICNANPGATPGALCSGGALVSTFTDITLGTPCTGTLQALNNQFNPTAGAGCSNPGLTDGQGNVVAFATAGMFWCEYQGPPLSVIVVTVCPFPGNGGGGGTPGGAPHSTQINSSGSFAGIPAAASGFVFTAAGTSNDPFWRSPAQLDVRDFGVKCDGLTNDTAAMQAAITAACTFSTTPKTLVLPNSCAVRLYSTLLITHCGGLTLDGGQSQGEASLSGGSGGPATFLYYGAPGVPAITVNQTRDSTFKNFSVFTNALNNLVNGASIGILIDEIAPVTGIVTNNKFENVQVWNGSSNPSFIGIIICPTAPGNCEAQNFERLFINCGLAAATSTNNGIGIQWGSASGASQPFFAFLHHYQPKQCSKAIDVELANILDIDGGLMDHNYTDLFLNGGRNIVYKHTRSENAIAQIVIGTGSSSPLHDVTLERNSFAGLSNNTTTISYPFSGTGGIIRLIRNDWDFNATVTPFGPTGGGVFSGTVTSQDNNYPNGTLCPALATLSAFVGSNDSPGNGPCPYSGVQLQGGNGRIFTNGVLNTLTLPPVLVTLGTSAIASGTCATVVTIPVPGVSLASGFVIHTGGTGYVLGDVLQINGGGGTAGGNVKVTQVSGSVITQVVVLNVVPGIAGTNLATIALTGSGTGATLDTVGDNILWNFIGDPTGITGYAPSASGALRIVSYPTANNMNFKVCNDTSGSITPGAATLNARTPR